MRDRMWWEVSNVDVNDSARYIWANSQDVPTDIVNQQETVWRMRDRMWWEVSNVEVDESARYIWATLEKFRLISSIKKRYMYYSNVWTWFHDKYGMMGLWTRFYDMWNHSVREPAQEVLGPETLGPKPPAFTFLSLASLSTRFCIELKTPSV